MDNQVRPLRKRKSNENQKDKPIKKQCNSGQKRDVKQGQAAIKKTIKKTKSADDINVAVACKISKEDVSNKKTRTKRGLRKETKNVDVKGIKHTKEKPVLKRNIKRGKGNGTKEKSENTSLSHLSKEGVDLLEDKSKSQKNTGMIVKAGKELENLKNDTKNFQQEIRRLQAEKDNLKDELQRSKGENESLSRKNAILESKISTVMKLNEDRVRQIESLELRLKQSVNDNEKRKSKLIQKEEIRESETTKLMNEIVVLKRDNTILQNKLTDLKRKEDDTEAKLQMKVNASEAKVLDLKRELETCKESCLEKDNTLKALQQDHKKLQVMYDTIQKELGHFKRIKTIHIQLFHGSKIPLVSKVGDEITVLLKQQMENDVTKLEVIECGQGTDVAPGSPVLIICISASRLGTDAQNTIKTLNVTSKMALLVFHHKDEHALPHQASEHVLTGLEFKRLGGIFDFGFLSSKGIYSCQLNDQNMKYLVNFINKETITCLKEVEDKAD